MRHHVWESLGKESRYRRVVPVLAAVGGYQRTRSDGGFGFVNFWIWKCQVCGTRLENLFETPPGDEFFKDPDYYDRNDCDLMLVGNVMRL